MNNLTSNLRKQFYIAFLFNFLVVLYLAKPYIAYLEVGETLFLKFFFLITFLTHFFFITVIPLILSTVILYLVKKNWVKYVFIFLNIVLLIYIKIDALIFSQFKYHLSPVVFNLVFGKKSGDIFQFSLQNKITFGAIILIIILAQFLFLKIASNLSNRTFYFKTTLITFLFLTITSNFIHAWGDANYNSFIMQYKQALPVYFPLTADTLLAKLNMVDEEACKKKENLLCDKNSGIVNYPLTTIKSTPLNHKKNILFIVIDTWRFDCISQEITPNIYNFSKESNVFENHRSGSNMTTGGVFSMFYGIPATYFMSFTTARKSPVLINELQKNEYQLKIYSSSTLENPPFNLNVFSNVDNLRTESKGNSPCERDLSITNEWLADIDNLDNSKPFFGFLFYDSAHGFSIPKNYKTKFNPTLQEPDYLAINGDYNPEKLINLYKNSLYYVDELVGQVINQLKEKNLLENTTIIITGDHGQEFNDNKKGHWLHGGNFSDYQIKVPFIYYDGKTKKTYTHNTFHYDLAPTLCKDMLNVQNEIRDYSIGKNLFDTKKRDWFICGYNQKYSIICNSMITNISESGSYQTLDKNLNLTDGDLDVVVLKDAFEINSRFYKK